jgi:hypothetical protein
MPRDFLRFGTLPNRATPAAIATYVRDSAAFAGGVDPRFRAAVREAMIERRLPLDLSYASRMLAPGWRGAIQPDDVYWHDADSHGRLFYDANTGLRTIRDYCGAPSGNMIEMWLKEHSLASAALADETYVPTDMPTPVAVSGSLIEFVTDASLAAASAFHASLTPFDYWPWVLDAEAVYPKLHTSVFSMADMGDWPATPVLNYNPVQTTTSLAANAAKLGTFALIGNYKDYPVPGGGSSYTIPGKHLYADLVADILATTPDDAAVGAGEYAFYSRVYNVISTEYALGAEETYVTAGSGYALRACGGSYRLTPRAVIEDNALITSIKLGVASYVRLTPSVGGSAEVSKYVKQQFDLVDMTHAAGVWTAPAQRTGPAAFGATLAELITPLSVLAESESETIFNMARNYRHYEYPVCMIVEWNFKAFPEGYAPL